MVTYIAKHNLEAETRVNNLQISKQEVMSSLFLDALLEESWTEFLFYQMKYND